MAEPITAANLVPKVDAGSLINGISIFLMVFIALATLGFILWYYLRKKKYNQYTVRILDKDSNGKSYERPDRAGVFLDKKTGFKLLWLEKEKIGMNPNNIPYISRLDKKGRIIKIVTLRKIGVNNYVYIDIKVGETVEISVGEEDLNNATQEMVKIRRTFNKESWLSKLAPYMMFIITVLITMIILISLFNKFTVLEEVSKNMKEVTENQYKITTLMYNLTKTPALNPGAPIIVPGGTT